MDAGLTRRRLVGLAAGGAAAFALGARVGVPGAEARRRVVVVGAGLAGLTTAYELERRGFDVTVLEARDRIGGRAHTVWRPFAQGQHAEAGGEYVDALHREVHGYCRRFGLGLENTSRGFGTLTDLVYRNGVRKSVGGFMSGGDWRDVNAFYRRVYRLSRHLDPADPAGTGAALDAHSVADVLDDLSPTPRARFMLETYIRDDYASTPDALSLLYLCQQEKLYEGVPGRKIENRRIRGGSSRLPHAFAARLGGEVLLSSPVTAISHGPDGVEVTAAGHAHEAEWCVLALPLRPLGEVGFSPALPSDLAAAVAGISYGHVTKNLIGYERRYWRDQGYSGDVVTDLPLGTTWEATDQQGGRAGILIDYAGASSSAFFEPLDETDRITHATARIDEVFPESEAGVAGTASVSWPVEPYTGGSWVAPEPGEMAHWEALRPRRERLVLAGEHTGILSGYMESAVRSGQRAARLIQQAS